MKLKKRIIGFLLLIGIVLIIIPLFFGRSIPSDELKLSGRVPAPPPKPKAITAPLPLQSATVPQITQTPKPTTEEAAGSSVVFEQLESTANEDSNVPAINDAMTPVKAPSVTPEAPSLAQSVAASPSNVATTQVIPKEDVAKLVPFSPMPDVTPATPPAVSASTTTVAKKDTPTQKNTPAKQKKSTKSAQKTTPKSPPKASKLPPGAEAWSVQLGSFTEKANAQKLMRELQSKGFTAYLRTTKTTKGNFIRVLVGPRLQQSDAAQLQSRIQKELNIQGVLIKAGG